MNAYHDIATVHPPTPGYYWLVKIWIENNTGPNGVRTKHILPGRHVRWDGSAWDDTEDNTHWLGEVKHGNNI